MLLFGVKECSRFVPFVGGISHISQGRLPETKSRSSVATMRMPVFSEMRREARLPTAFGARRTGNPRTSNQKSLTAMTASVIRPWPCQGKPSQKPRLSGFLRCRLMAPMWCSGDCFSRSVHCHSSPRSMAGSATSR